VKPSEDPKYSLQLFRTLSGLQRSERLFGTCSFSSLSALWGKACQQTQFSFCSSNYILFWVGGKNKLFVFRLLLITKRVFPLLAENAESPYLNQRRFSPLINRPNDSLGVVIGRINQSSTIAAACGAAPRGVSPAGRAERIKSTFGVFGYLWAGWF